MDKDSPEFRAACEAEGRWAFDADAEENLARIVAGSLSTEGWTPITKAELTRGLPESDR